jgi:hypothetical protein
MSETTLQLSQIGDTIFVREYPWEQQAWRWAFENGVAWNSNDDPVFNYAASFILYGFIDLRQITLFLVYGTESSDSPFLANITLQGVFSPRHFGKGSVSAASKEYAKTIGATFELTASPKEGYKHQLTIDTDIFQDQAASMLSNEAIRAFTYRAAERIPYRHGGERWPQFP